MQLDHFEQRNLIHFIVYLIIEFQYGRETFFFSNQKLNFCILKRGIFEVGKYLPFYDIREGTNCMIIKGGMGMMNRYSI